MLELGLIEELYVQCIDVTSVHTDWEDLYAREGNEGYGYWEAFAPPFELSSGKEVTLVTNGFDLLCIGDDATDQLFVADGSELDDEELCEELNITEEDLDRLRDVDMAMYAEGPMMNYRYPLGDRPDRIGGFSSPISAAEAAFRLRNLPLVVVEVDGDAALTLSGGGMDLSWEINEAFIRLGYLPPIAFELPGMAGRGESELDRYIIKARTRAIEVKIGQLQRDLGHHIQRWGTR